MIKEERRKSKDKRKELKKAERQSAKMDKKATTTDEAQPQYESISNQDHFKPLEDLETCGKKEEKKHRTKEPKEDKPDKKTKGEKREKGEKKEKRDKKDKKPFTLERQIKKVIIRELDRNAAQISEALAKAKAEGREYQTWELFSNFIVQNHDTICNECGMKLLIGVRYQCTVCEKYNLCEFCEDKSEHEHSFIKMKKASQVSNVENLKEMFQGMQIESIKAEEN